MNEKMSLLELNNRIRDALQGAFPETLWVVAEISEIKVNRTGHCYLELVEKDDVTDELTARARATIWSYTFRMLRPYFETTTGQPLAEGIKILVQVSVEYHPGYGLSLNIKDIDPTYTLGDLALRRREIIRRLEEAGVFHMNQELPLPLVPQRIAVISSATAAGYQDFTDQLENNAYGFQFEVRLFEAFMQGSEAVPSILDALDRIFHEEAAFDAVAILRGGGSQADLSCFDHFDLAFAVAQFPLPVITGIGHEKDETIVDLVAHTRQKTPTAVAEFFIAGVLRFSEQLEALEKAVAERSREILSAAGEEIEETTERLRTAFDRYTRLSEMSLRKAVQRLFSGSGRLLSREAQQLHQRQFRLPGRVQGILRRQEHLLENAGKELHHALRRTREKEKARILNLSVTLRRSVRHIVERNNTLLDNAEKSSRLLDPRNVLLRGFTISRQKGITIRSSAGIDPTAPLTTRFADGTTESKIIKTTRYDNQKTLLPGGDE